MLQEIDIKRLSGYLKNEFPEILFAFLFGSSQKGKVSPGSDIDMAIYLDKNASKTRLIPAIMESTESVCPGIECDIIILNTAGPIVAFEALRGTELFIRKESMDIYAGFYSFTCRSHEDHIWWMKEQLEYRGYEVQWDY